MPELPEVETIKLGLRKTVVGQSILVVDVRLPKMFVGDQNNVIGRRIEAVERRGKLLILVLSGDLFLLIHLKMTGQLIFKSSTHPLSAKETKFPDKSTKVIFTFESRDQLFYNDYRTFGYLKLVDREELRSDRFLSTVGIEPLTEEFTPRLFHSLLLKSPTIPIKVFLLDQSRIAGLGNIYVDEALFASGILPTRVVGSLRVDEEHKLYLAIREVLTKGVELGGSSKTTYVDVSGGKGTFLSIAKVYGRAGKPCAVCGTPIVKISFRGRGTHFCPNCQH